MVPFAGYEMPVQYTSVLEETKLVRSQGGLFDVSHMGQFSIRGKNALLEVQKLVSNDLRKIQLGQAQYNMLCNEKGGTIDDLVVYHRNPEHTYICVNASNRQADFTWIKEHLQSSHLEDESDRTALLALQGPQAELLLEKFSDPGKVKGLKYYWAADAKVFGYPCYLSRTGYTGEDGFELYIAAKDSTSIWERLLEEGRKVGLIPAGLGARDTLRLEMGYPLHGHELSANISPLSAGLGWVVKLQKEETFIGQKALQKEMEKGPERVLKALKLSDRRIARQGYRLLSDAGKVIGEITSGTFSPHLECPIALGFVQREYASQTSYLVEIRESQVGAEVVKLPFLKPKTKKL